MPEQLRVAARPIVNSKTVAHSMAAVASRSDNNG